MLQALKLFFPMDKLNWLPGTVPVLWASLPETHREQTAQNIELLSQMVMTMFSLILLRHYFFFSQYFFCLFLCCRSIFFNMSYQNHFYVPTFPTLYFFSFESTVSLHLFPSNNFDYSSFPFPTLYVWKGITKAPLPQLFSLWWRRQKERQLLFLWAWFFHCLDKILARTENYQLWLRNILISNLI